jgi:maltose O-acetyltransferase
MKDKFIFLLYLILSKFPDIYFLSFWFNNITKLRARVLNLLSSYKIGKKVKIYRNVNFSKSSNIFLGDNVIIKENCKLSGKITIGDNTVILSDAKIDGSGEVIIGSNSHIGRENDIFSHYHILDRKDILVNFSQEVFQKTEIGNNVMLFSRVGIMSGVKIDDNCVIGYGSVVTKNCEKNGIYVGVPAKKMAERC